MSEKDYSNMSLGEIIRDMKEKKVAGFAEEKQVADNSPFLRRNSRNLLEPKFPLTFKSKFLNDRSNYINHMAKKKIKNALKTDLRFKLNRLKATTEGLDLRWKIVANEIDRIRNARRLPFEGQPPTTRMATDPNIQEGEIMYRRSRLSMSHLERRVGMKLTEWFYGTTARSSPPPLILHQPIYHYHHHHQSGTSSVVSSCCQTGSSNGFIDGPIQIYEAPPLANYLADDMHPSFTSQPPPLAWCNPQDADDEIYKLAETEEEEVEYIVEDRLESDQCTKVTLHQRFSSLH